MCVWSDTRTAILANGCAPRRGYRRHLANRCKQSQDQCCILQGHACEYITIGRNWVVAICIPQYTWVVNCILGFGPKAMIYLCERCRLNFDVITLGFDEKTAAMFRCSSPHWTGHMLTRNFRSDLSVASSRNGARIYGS